MNARKTILTSVTLGLAILTSGQLHADYSGDTFFGTSGGELIFADWNSIVFAYGGADEIIGSHSADKLLGGRGWDIIYGEKGEDVIAGQGGRDKLSGGSSGREEGDKLYGGSGYDVCHEFEVNLDRSWTCEYHNPSLMDYWYNW